ncbi:MAG TPA: hypothetical protein PLL10_00145 [Elusimicrobiales bacterium]|nr:hypothetical protein [Elusimicrobiales bacterium]
MRAGGFLDMLIGGLLGGDDGGPPPIKNMPPPPQVQQVFNGSKASLPGVQNRPDLGSGDDRQRLAQDIMKGGGL